jgi:hypothetical protein
MHIPLRREPAQPCGFQPRELKQLPIDPVEDIDLSFLCKAKACQGQNTGSGLFYDT